MPKKKQEESAEPITLGNDLEEVADEPEVENVGADSDESDDAQTDESAEPDTDGAEETEPESTDETEPETSDELAPQGVVDGDAFTTTGVDDNKAVPETPDNL